MAYKDWDNREYWEDGSRCVVCHEDMSDSQVLICSATCEDISLRRESQSYPEDESVRWEGWEKEYDCYA